MLLLRVIATWVISLLLSLFPALGASAASSPGAQDPVYTYDAQHYSGAMRQANTERGPPSAYDPHTTHSVVDRWTYGTSACSDGPTARAPITYDDSTAPVQGAQAAGTTRWSGRVADPDAAAIERVGVAANTGRRAFEIHPRVAGQLNDPRLGSLRGRLSSNDLQELAHNPNATYLMDNATGHINVVQQIDGVILRITVPRDAFRIISVGRMRPNQIPNGLESGRFVDIGPGG